MQPGDEEQEDRVVVAQNERDQHRQSNATTVAWVASVIIYVVLTLFSPLLDSDGTPPDWALTKTWGSFLYELRVGFGNALVTFFMFTVVYDVVKRKGAESTERALISALSGNSRIVGMLSIAEKKRHLTQTLRALLGDEFANALFGDMIEPILSASGGYRSKYQYSVTMLEIDQYPELTKYPTLRSLIVPDIYHWVREQIDYVAHSADGSVLSRSSTIVLAFDKDSLQSLYADPTAYFRSLIELNPESKAAFLQLRPTEIKSFLKEVMRFRLTETVTRNNVNFDVAVNKSPIGSPIITITAAALQSQSLTNKLRVDFIYPHQRDATHFTYSMPQPCRDPYMTFKGCTRIQCLEMIDYFSKVSQDRRRIEPMGIEANPSGFEIEIDGWVFPMSGVTFTWRNR